MPVIETGSYRLSGGSPAGSDGSVTVLLEPEAGEVLSALVSQEGPLKKLVILVPHGSSSFDFDLGRYKRAGSEKAPLVGLFSSGSTGVPKLHFHSLKALSEGVNPQHKGKAWGMLYRPDRMAGIQVLLQALASSALVIDAGPRASLERALEEFATHGVDSLSATPSRWRMVLATPNHRDLDLRFVSMGGEVCDQKILDRMRDAFPRAQIRHIYATTETGPVFSVGDGFSGFPVSFLGRKLSSGRSLEIANGQLSVSWIDSAVGRETSVATGDLVEVVGDRVRFLGRTDDVINVGGTKVSLSEIESAILTLSGSQDCVAYAVANPFLGQVVGADIVWSGLAPSEIETKTALRNVLPRQAVPAVINSVPEIDLSETFKKIRRR